jgi:hypothetical protein
MQVQQPSGGNGFLAGKHEDLPINGNEFANLYKNPSYSNIS